MGQIERKIISNPAGGTVVLFGNLAASYQTEIDKHDAAACDCKRTVFTLLCVSPTSLDRP